jgi:hypothetical protein
MFVINENKFERARREELMTNLMCYPETNLIPGKIEGLFMTLICLVPECISLKQISLSVRQTLLRNC